MPHHPLPWLEPGDDFPPVHAAWDEHSGAAGLLAAGGELSANSLQKAYRNGIFPWFSEGQPILWWSTDPRMVLRVQAFKLPVSLRKHIRSLLRQGRLDIRMDHGFAHTMQACADSPRPGQNGTWISADMVAAYTALHTAGHAHSVETWLDGQQVGGLYVVNMGRMVFGESMFSRVSNASKIALAALVAFCVQHDLPMIDCQQETAHLASLGAQPLSRADFLPTLGALAAGQSPVWRFEPSFWQTLPGF